MSHTLAPPTALQAIRGFCARQWRDPDARSTLIGILGVLAIHLLLWLLAPMVLRFETIPITARADRTREFKIELEPDLFAKNRPKPAPPSRFVETNPDAPENIPDRTSNFAAHNQQVAQEKPTPDGKSDRPTTEGRTDIDSTAIVTGSLTQPREQLPPVPAAPEVPVAETPVTPPKAEKVPLPGEEKIEGENKDGVGSSIAKRLPRASAVPEPQEGAKDAKEFEGPATQPAIDPRRPQPRPTLVTQPQVRPAILSEHRVGTANLGVIAHTALKTTYGQYLQRIIETVQIQWERILIEQRANPVSGSTVQVRFILDAEGRIARIVNVETTANQVASNACVSAITDRSPYPKWTDDMKAILGEQQELVFTFHYL